MKSNSEHRRVRRTPMTLDEALQIEQQLARGTLDMSLPGTQELVDEARRVHLSAELWGEKRTDQKRRQLRIVLWAGAGLVTLYILGLVAMLAFSR
ncbi:hypothetical protein ACFOYW_04235 [Gryllotalpicola reticulitermitis]|uniref:DUF3040 domain-containing protein n=1 Tax=Gryllotalpicola reticulitermitis TaxID=1184153 RepID=A0ABV8Q5G9_9MICO